MAGKALQKQNNPLIVKAVLLAVEHIVVVVNCPGAILWGRAIAVTFCRNSEGILL